MIYKGQHGERFEVTQITAEAYAPLQSFGSNELALVWFVEDDSQLVVDGIQRNFDRHHMMALTEFHQIDVLRLSRARILKWNRSFYCIVNHDSEVGCKGILFYGAQHLPIMNLTPEDKTMLTTVWKMLELEMVSRDNLQEEMLEMMLKRILILTTRIYKSQVALDNLEEGQKDIVREYHFLVAQHFKTKHTVADYAALLHKSPKTLSNVFKKLGAKSPLQYIKDRKLLEARRLLAHTDMSVSEIGYDIGFSDVQSFSRFFKKGAGVSPKEYRDADVGGEI